MTFGEFLRHLRERSYYPEQSSFSEKVGINRNLYQSYEHGVSIPATENIERILSSGIFSTSDTEKLKELWNEERASKLGVLLNNTKSIDIPALAARIQREIEFELKRGHSVSISPRTSRVCARRVEIILTDALGKL